MTCSEPKTVKARKPHRCAWCGEAINPGDTYVRWVGFDGGDVIPTECHPECKVAWDQGMREDPWYFGEEVGYGDHCRGCLCERGRCECGKATKTVAPVA